MNEENKSKLLIGTLVAVITLLVVVIGATYAFFSLNVSGDTTNINVDIETGNADVVTIQQGAENIHINLAVSDMTENNPNKVYYATNTDDNYKLTEEDGTLTFATITGTNKEKSDCTAKVTITMDTSKDSMGKALQKGDAILYITSGKTEETIDLYDLLSEEIPASVTKEIEVELSVSESAEASITGYLKVNNTESDQSYLAGKTLNITITVNNLACGGAKGNAVAYIVENSTSGTLETTTSLETRNEELTGEGVSTEDLDTLRRFVGEYTDVDNNFICFGTSDTNTCKDNLDQYMYRIIGIDETNNQLKIIKATKIVKGTQYTFQWFNEYSLDIGWEESYLYKYLNASEVNNTKSENYFVGNTYYSYMQDTTWTDLIIEHPTWHTGIDSSYSPYVAKTSYKNELSNKLTSANSIGLMYISDYLYACSGDFSTWAYTNKTNWLFIENGLNGTLNTGNPNSGVLQQPKAENEWTMTYSGLNVQSYIARQVCYLGTIDISSLNGSYSIRPVFYLDGSKVMLNGKGTIGEPYYITNVSS